MVTEERIQEAKQFYKLHFGSDVFNEEGSMFKYMYQYMYSPLNGNPDSRLHVLATPEMKRGLALVL